MSPVAASRGVVLLSYGFRPFFLLAACAAVGTLGVLLIGLAGVAEMSDRLAVTRWHGHEMLFGFVAAAIAGFLLTAVPTWTGTKPVAGPPLLALVALWLVGRAVMSPWLGLQSTRWVLLEPLFFPALAVLIALPLVKSRNYRNFQFVLLLALLTAADLLFFAMHFGWLAVPFDPLHLAVDLVVLMIAVVGGRIVPLFTRNALVKSGETCEIAPAPWLDRASLAAVAGLIVVDVARPGTPLAGAVAGIAAALLALRLCRWHGHRTLQMPIVFILHAGYAWLVLGLAMKAAWLIARSPWGTNWLHALTAGAFGTMVLAVMTRVALGHSGRALVVSRPITIAYVLVVAGAALRVSGAAVPANLYWPVLLAAGAAWGGAFLIFLVVYWPIMVTPRR